MDVQLTLVRGEDDEWVLILPIPLDTSYPPEPDEPAEQVAVDGSSRARFGQLAIERAAARPGPPGSFGNKWLWRWLAGSSDLHRARFFREESMVGGGIGMSIPRRLLLHQFGVGRSIRMISRPFAGTRRGSRRRPSCSSSALRRDGLSDSFAASPGRTGTGAARGDWSKDSSTS